LVARDFYFVSFFFSVGILSIVHPMVANASSQAGVFAGLNPASFNASDPIVLFIIQVCKTI
jgi:hypothetical protein